ncbi:MAG: DEAD/DEAH box helicase, partial [Deltaproteobacteria bacterium]
MQRFIRKLKEEKYFGADLTHYEHLEKKSAVYGKPEYPLPQSLENILKSLGISRLYSHQVKALDILETGKNLVVSTPTASGKSLIYHLHSLRVLNRNPDSHILYLFPIKALAQDQLSSLKRILSSYPSEKPLRVGIFDGDTKQSERKKLKSNPPEILISNPDMLHLSFLAYNHQWHNFLKTLRVVVLDEIHTY